MHKVKKVVARLVTWLAAVAIAVVMLASTLTPASAQLWSNKRGCAVDGRTGAWYAYYTDHGQLEGIGPKRFFQSSAIKDCRAWVDGV